MFRNNVLPIIFCLSLLGCGSKLGKNISQTFDYGRIENNKYVNDYFQMEVIIPAGWITLDRDFLNQAMDQEEDSMVIKYKNYKKHAVNEISSTILLTAKKEIADALPDTILPVFSVVVRNKKDLPEIKSAKDYLLFGKSNQIKAGMHLEYDSEFMPIDIGGKRFFRMRIHSAITADYFARVEKDFFFLSS